jgi:DNA-directed RNA polymerase specialized sigma24 family protein
VDDRDDGELLAASGRDPEAFRVLYRRHAEGLLAYLQRRTHDPQDALDVLAETFATVYRKRRSYRSERGEVAGWIYGIAKFEVARLQRSRARRFELGRRLQVQAPVVDEDSY